MNDQSILMAIARERSALVERASRLVVRVGGGEIVSRSGTRLDATTVATVAIEASEGERVAVQAAPNAEPGVGRVTRFERETGIAILELEGDGAGEAAPISAGVALGTTLISVAFPSREGFEARSGMVRCIGRDGSYLQSDSPAFPGFAGSPVVDVTGALVGMNALGAGGNDSLIWPVERLRAVVEGHTPERERRRHAWLGVATQQVPLDEAFAERYAGGGALVTAVEADSPAHRGGLRYGDVIVELGGTVVDGPHALASRIVQLEAGTSYPIVVVRAGATESLEVTPVEAPQGHEGRHSGGHDGGGHGHRWRRWAAATMMG